MTESLSDNGFLYMLVTVLVEFGLIWVALLLARLLVTRIAAEDRQAECVDKAAWWCEGRIEPKWLRDNLHRLRHGGKTRYVGDRAKVAEFQRLIYLRRIGVRV